MQKKVQILLIIVLGALHVVSVQYLLSNPRNGLIQKYLEHGKGYLVLPDKTEKTIPSFLKNIREGAEKMLGFGGYDVKKDVTYIYYSRDNLDGKPIEKRDDFQGYVDKNKPTKLITHGWMASGKGDTCSKIKDGFLHKYDANVIVMDWNPIAKTPVYPTAMKATWDVGKEYSEALNYLIEDVGVSPEHIHLLGHSLGAHVSGFAGRNVRKVKVGRITGLDPALPGFETRMVEGKSLKNTDAQFVDVIHTCAGYLGYKAPIGHADIYPNGGTPPQPGCNILDNGCSHHFSWKLYASSLFRNSSYMASKCADMNQATDKKKCEGDQVPIGDPTPLDARGIYYAHIPKETLIFT